MKLRILLPLVILFFLNAYSSDIPDDYKGVISVRTSIYNEGLIPQWTDTFNLTLYKMRHSHLLDDLIISKETHFVTNGIYHFAPDTGRYIIFVSKDSLSGALDFNYQGGTISFTLNLQ